MRATSFMTSDVVTVRPNTTVRDATRVLLEHRVAALPVLDDDGRLVGIVSELDLLRERVVPDVRAHASAVPAPAGPPPRTVADVMTEDVVALTEADDEAAFAELLRLSGVKSIPVVNGERLVGIVGRRDLLRLLARSDVEVERDVERALQAERAAVGPCGVTVHEGLVRLTGVRGPEEADRATRLAGTVAGVVRVEVALAPHA